MTPTIGRVDRWRIDDFRGALTSLSARTVEAYGSDLAAFAEWCARSGLDGPDAVRRTTVRRYLAFLTTRRFARRTIARKVASLRRYYRCATTHGIAEADNFCQPACD